MREGAMAANNFPKLHNAMWPGLVGKGSDSEPGIELDTLLDLTAKAEVNGTKFDGVDIFHVGPHTNIDCSDDEIKRLADKVAKRNLVIGSIVAPVWPPVGGGSAMGSPADRKKFVENVRKSCNLGKRLRDLGVRHYGVIRIDSSCSPADWAKDPAGNTKKIAKTFREACSVASDYGERLAAEGEICWGGMHSWKDMINTLEETNRPQTIGFQADMAHTLLYTMGYNAPKSRLLPAKYDWKSKATLDEALKKMTDALRLDDRFPCGPKRRHCERLGLPRQDWPSLHGHRQERQARYRQARGLLAARPQRRSHEGLPPHLLGWLHVPQ
jgi:sugar phosphate isomerase/epimerase